MHLHPYVAAELNRQRCADLFSAADNFRRARTLLRQRNRHPLRVRLAAAASVLVADGVARRSASTSQRETSAVLRTDELSAS